jgi:type VI secretion system protein ImpK
MSADETVIASAPPPRPNPGGRLSVATPASTSTSPSERLWESICVDRLSPLVAAALPLLDLCVRLKTSASHADVEGLRLRVLREIDAFERRVTPLGLAPRAIRASKYALCATVDDLVLNTPWGSRSIWTTRSMVGSLFSETGAAIGSSTC